MTRPAKYISRRGARKEALRPLLLARDWGALTARAAGDRGTISTLLSLLLERDDLLRWRAIEGLGRVAAALAPEELEEVRNLIRKLFWSMNDESGSQAWHAAEALGEILYQVPTLAEEYTTILAGFAEIYPFEAGVQWALGRVAALPASPARQTVPTLRDALEHEDPRVRGFAADALGKLRIAAAIPALEALRQDPAPIPTYDPQGGQLGTTTVGELARQALGRLDAVSPSPGQARPAVGRNP